MQAITIGTAEGIEDIRQSLDDEIRFLQEEGVHIRIGQSTRGSFAFLDCSIDEASGNPNEADLLLRHYVASALSDVIVDKWEQSLIRKIIKVTYSYFAQDEQETIAQYARQSLSGSTEQVPRANRKAQVLHRLRDYLDDSDELVVEGFVNFRLQEYLAELEDAVDRAVDDFLMEREYREFIRLLKYFVDVQEPRMDHVHVIIGPGGTFKLVDDEGVSIRSEYLEEFVVEMVETEINYDDLLISALITLAPRALTVHVPDSPDRDESVETIKGVFGERVTMCLGCSLCVQSGDASLATRNH